MCILRKEIGRIENENKLGFREWVVVDSGKFLNSINVDFLWPKNSAAHGDINMRRDIVPEGIYSYSSLYNYHNYNNNYDNYYNYNYNNYDYDYNYNYNYNYNNYNRNDNYNYRVFGEIENRPLTIQHELGYRSSEAIIKKLIILDKIWFNDSKTKKFAEHFNSLVIDLAKEYNAEVITYSEYKL